jgi:replicative DNA helicase
VVTTEQIAATLRVTKDQRANHSIPVAAPLDLPEVDLPIEPYVLGGWLGDGTSTDGCITIANLATTS